MIAGIGNVYRAELLFRHGIDPYLPGRAARRRDLARACGADLVALMRAGVRAGRIVTVAARGPAPQARAAARDEAGYVYRRTGLPCRVCGTEIRTEVLVGRNLYLVPGLPAARLAGRPKPPPRSGPRPLRPRRRASRPPAPGSTAAAARRR